MFGKRITLFRLSGFAVRLDLSWVVIALLVTWSLATSLFPQRVQNLPQTTYWLMGVAGALGLFASIVFHELAHAMVARRYGLTMKGITLFIFGGVAEMADEPDRPRTEFWMAIAGPVASVLLAGLFAGLGVAAYRLGIPISWVGVLGYLAFINALLVAFNLIPAFPLDGGRVLRSALWAWKADLEWATRIVTLLGSAFGMVLMALGMLSLLVGDFIGGLWWFLIGLFLRGAAQSSYQQLIVREVLAGSPVSQFMTDHPITVSPDTTIADLVEHYIYRHHHKLYPVVEDGRLLGCVNVRQIKQVPREEWPQRSVRDLLDTCGDGNTIAPDTDAVNALARMNRAQVSRLMVVDGDRLLGVLTLKDLLQFLSLKMELEGS